MSEFRPTTTDMAPWLEQAWMERYLNRELTEDESDWFEAYILNRPGLAVELKIDVSLTKKAFFDLQRPSQLASTSRFALAGSLIFGLVFGLVFAWGFGQKFSRLPSESIKQPTIYALHTSRAGAKEREWKKTVAGDGDFVLLYIPAISERATLVSTDVNGATRSFGPVESDGAFFTYLVPSSAAKQSLRLVTSDTVAIVPSLGEGQ